MHMCRHTCISQTLETVDQKTERKILLIQKEHAPFSKSYLTFSMLHCGRAYLSIALCTCLALKLYCQSCRELLGLTEAAGCNPSCPHLKPAQAFEQTQAEPMAWLIAKPRHWGEPFEPRNQTEEMSADKASARIDSVWPMVFSSGKTFFSLQWFYLDGQPLSGIKCENEWRLSCQAWNGNIIYFFGQQGHLNTFYILHML